MITINDIENDAVKVDSFAEELLSSIEEKISSIKINYTDQIASLLNNLNRILSYYVKTERADGNIHFSRGRLVGISDFYKCILSVYQNKKKYSEKVDDIAAALRTIRHGSDILNYLSLSRGVQHKELSNEVGINSSTLTGIMDKLINLQVVDYNKIGKFKFYYLTEDGQNYKVEKKLERTDIIEELQRRLNEVKQQITYEREKNYQLTNLHRNLDEISLKYKIMSISPSDIIMVKNKDNKKMKSRSIQKLFGTDEKNNAYKSMKLCTSLSL